MGLVSARLAGATKEGAADLRSQQRDGFTGSCRAIALLCFLRRQLTCVVKLISRLPTLYRDLMFHYAASYLTLLCIPPIFKEGM